MKTPPSPSFLSFLYGVAYVSGKISLLAMQLSRWDSLPRMMFGLCVSIRSCRSTFFLSLIRLLQFTVVIQILFAVWSELLLVSDEGASPTPVSPVNDESDSDKTLNELLSSGDSVSLRKNECECQ